MVLQAAAQAVIGVIQVGIMILVARRWRGRAGRAWIIFGMTITTVGSQAGWYGIDHGWLASHRSVTLNMIVMFGGLVCCLIGLLAAAKAEPRSHDSGVRS
jgi:uncharacterized membrane protein YhaH (DUF805 family)